MAKENPANPADDTTPAAPAAEVAPATTASGAVIEDRSSAPASTEIKREYREETLANGVILSTVVSVEPRGDVIVGGAA